MEERKTGEKHDQVHCWKHVYLLVNVNRAQQIQAKYRCGPENCDLLFKGNGDVARTGKTSTFWSRTSTRQTRGMKQRLPRTGKHFDILVSNLHAASSRNVSLRIRITGT